MVMGGRAVPKGQEPAEKAELLLAEARDIGEGLIPPYRKSDSCCSGAIPSLAGS
jgi:hypothetical protein